MAPVAEISKIVHLASIDEEFRNGLLDPDTRGETLEKAETGWKIYDGVPLTSDEKAGLLDVEATDMPGYAQACASYDRLVSRK